MRSMQKNLGLAALLAVSCSAWAGVEGTLDTRNGALFASDTVGPIIEFYWEVVPADSYDPMNFTHTTTDNGRVATVTHNSQWLGDAPSDTTGFTIASTYTVTKPSGVGLASGTEHTQIKLHVTGQGGGSIPYDFIGSLSENGGDGWITLNGPGVSISISATVAWDQTVHLKDGDYTLNIQLDETVNGSAPATKSVAINVTLKKHEPPVQCNAGAGPWFLAHPGVGCNDIACCDAVCIIDPTCCDTAWDNGCVTVAANNCAMAPATGLIINPVNGHRYQLVTPATWFDSIEFSSASEDFGAIGCPVTINNAAKNEWVRNNLASHVPGFAEPADLFISEYYEGTNTNNHAIEIYNGSPGSVDLAVGNYQLLIYSNGSTRPIAFALAGVIPAHGTWVVAPANAGQSVTELTDQLIPAGFFFDGNDAIALAHGAVNIDVIGQIGFDPGSEWGSGLASTKDNVIRRKSSIGAGDANGSDAFDPAGQWDGYLSGDFSGLGNHLANVAGSFPVWIGCDDADIEGFFPWWCGGTTFTYSNWAVGEPDDSGNQDFGELDGGTGKWHTQGGLTMDFGVTEFALGFCGVGNGCFAPSVGPGCNDESCCNVVCVMDQHCCITSWDATCVSEANDLCKPGVLHGPFFNPATGHNYYLLETAAWSEAEKKAQSLGGTLATIDDAAENSWVLTNVSRFDGSITRTCFLGLHDQLFDGSFQWIDHKIVAYTNWGIDEPQVSSSRNFLELKTNGKWQTADNTGDNLNIFAIVEVGCTGDLDASGAVDAADLAMLLGGWGTNNPQLDLTHDGIVDAGDLAVLLGAWGSCGG